MMQEMKDGVLKEVIFQPGEYLTGQFRAEGIAAFCDMAEDKACSSVIHRLW